MALSEKQKELDKIKWEKSQLLKIDACGTFNYCKCCDKNIENPCEQALNSFMGNNKTEKPVEKNEVIDKVEVKTKEKKTTTKKATAKKSESKKSTTKKSCAKKTKKN